MFRIKSMIIILVCIQAIFVGECSAKKRLRTNPNPIVAAYYENWSQYRPGVGGRPPFMPNLIDPTILTDVYFAFGIFGFVTRSIDPSNPHLTGDFTIQPVEWNDQTVLYPQVQALKQRNPSLRTLLSIGGWSFNDPNDPNGIGQFTYPLFSQMVASSQNRAQFIASAVDYARKYGFDGIDIDWEFPGVSTRGGQPEDFDNFVLFLQEASQAFKAANPPLLLTIASAAIVPAGVPQVYLDNPSLYFQWLASCAPYLDRFNIMAYDYHGPFDVPQLTGVNAPLNAESTPGGQLNVKTTLKNYLDNGVPASKMVLGMPTYGHTFGGVTGLSPSDFGPGKPFSGPGAAGPSTQSPGLLAYFEIADMISSKVLTFGTDSTTSTAVAFNVATNEWVSFDTPDTITLKAQEAKDNGLAGVMVWAIDDDEYWWTKFPNTTSAFNVFYPKLKRPVHETYKIRRCPCQNKNK